MEGLVNLPPIPVFQGLGGNATDVLSSPFPVFPAPPFPLSLFPLSLPSLLPLLFPLSPFPFIAPVHILKKIYMKRIIVDIYFIFENSADVGH